MTDKPLSWHKRLGANWVLALSCALVSLWSLILISANENLTESRVLFALTALGSLMAVSGWLSVRWRRAEQRERKRNRAPYTLNSEG